MDRTLLIAIAGPSGSGKTLLAQSLLTHLPEGQAVLLSADRYYHDLSHLPQEERAVTNFDDPEALDHQRLADDLAALRRGEAIEAPVYDFVSHARTAQTDEMRPAAFVVAEGNFLLAWPACRDLFDLKVFVSVPDEICLERRLARDVAQRGRSTESVHEQYERQVRPMCVKHILPSALHADLVLDGRSAPGEMIEQVMRRLFAGDKPGMSTEMESGVRRSLIDELDARLAGSALRRWRYVWKKLAWLGVVRGTAFVKRAVDVVVAGLALILISPLFALLALAIKLTDGGPIFYVSKRVGKWGREFPFPKFRSMVVNADKIKDDLLALNQHGEEGVTFKMKRDPRVTWIGRIMRRLSLDESPQLWSVLVGDMTLVGPRPPVPREVALYTLSDRRRLDVTPGITCIWQVSGRAEIPFPEQVELDVRYIESQSFWLDIVLLARTIPAVLLGRGAY